MIALIEQKGMQCIATVRPHFLTIPYYIGEGDLHKYRSLARFPVHQRIAGVLDIWRVRSRRCFAAVHNHIEGIAFLPGTLATASQYHSSVIVRAAALGGRLTCIILFSGGDWALPLTRGRRCRRAVQVCLHAPFPITELVARRHLPPCPHAHLIPAACADLCAYSLQSLHTLLRLLAQHPAFFPALLASAHEVNSPALSPQTQHNVAPPVVGRLVMAAHVLADGGCPLPPVGVAMPQASSSEHPSLSTAAAAAWTAPPPDPSKLTLAQLTAAQALLPFTPRTGNSPPGSVEAGEEAMSEVLECLCAALCLPDVAEIVLAAPSCACEVSPTGFAEEVNDFSWQERHQSLFAWLVSRFATAGCRHQGRHFERSVSSSAFALVA